MLWRWRPQGNVGACVRRDGKGGASCRIMRSMIRLGTSGDLLNPFRWSTPGAISRFAAR
jgi:hypothetical protein